MQVEEVKRSKRRRAEEVPRPFVKFIGGKRRVLPELAKRLPEDLPGLRYHEPFVGGGALFWHLRREGRIGGRPVLSDTNDRLIRTYRGIRDYVGDVMTNLTQACGKHSADFFEKVRKTNPDRGTDDQVAAWLIYLNKTAYNGLYRVNASGQFNAPFGKYANPKILDEENLRACSRALQGVELCHADFADVRPGGPGDFFYFDPPYMPVTKTRSFTGYGPGGFTGDDQCRLAEHAANLKRAGAKVLLTNSDAPLVRELYPEPFWKVERVEARGDAVSCKAEGRGRVAELIIS